MAEAMAKIVAKSVAEAEAEAVAEAVAAAADPPLGMRHCPFDFFKLATHAFVRRASWLALAMEGADLVKGRAPASEPTVLVMVSSRNRAALLLKVRRLVCVLEAADCVIVIECGFEKLID